MNRFTCPACGDPIIRHTKSKTITSYCLRAGRKVRAKRTPAKES